MGSDRKKGLERRLRPGESYFELNSVPVTQLGAVWGKPSQLPG